MEPFLLLVTILPPILIVVIFVISDKFQEPNRAIIKVFTFGILITIPAFIANTFLYETYKNYYFINKSLSESFLSAAVIEEGLKFLILYFIVYKMNEFNEPMDGIVYGVCVSLGFATLENIYYVVYLSFGTDPILIAVLRTFTAIPAHGIFGVIMGYFFMKYSYVSKQKNLFLSFLIPYLLHGFYNYFITSYFMISLGVIIVSWIIGMKLYVDIWQKQKLKTSEYEPKI